MKHIIIVFLLLIIAIKSSGQAICPPYGISTNPDNAYNNQFPAVPSKRNTFDWRTRTYTFNYNNEPTPRILPSPFYDATPNVGFPTKLVIIKDMKPEDGWELLSREFGYENDNITKKVIQVQYPMLILYNKYTGLMRVFTSIKASDRNADYTSASMVLSMAGFNTSVLLPLNTPVLDFNPLLVPTAQSTFSNGDFKWFFADFQMNYDPCTCSQDSRIQITVNLLKTSKITLAGSLTGTLISVDNGATTKDDANNKWSFSKDNLIKSAERGKQTYESVDAFKKQELSKIEGAHQKNTSSISSALLGIIGLQLTAKKDDKKQKVGLLTEALRSSKFLTAGLKAAPYIGAAVSFLSSFIAGGNETAPDPQKVEIMPMAINAEIKLSGTITDEIPRNTYTISTPGSLYNATGELEWYPYYNEVLGVLNILEKPEVDYTPIISRSNTGGTGSANTRQHTYQLNKDIEFVINPAAGFKPNPEVQVAYVFEYADANDANLSTQIIEGIAKNYYGYALEPEGLGSLRTPYIPVKLLRDYLAITNLNNWSYFYNTANPSFAPITPRKVYLKFLINLERSNAKEKTQNVLYMVKYEVNLIQKPTGYLDLPANGTIPFIPTMPATLVFNNVTMNYTPGNAPYKAYDKIEITNSNILPAVVNALPYFYLPLTVNMQADEIVLTGTGSTAGLETVLDSSLGGTVILESMSALQTASQARVTSFCNDAKYKDDITRQSRMVRNPTKTETQAEEPKDTPTKSTQLLSVYPNPTTGEATITYEVEKEGSSVAIYLSNNLGIRVIEVSNEVSQAQGTHNVRIDTRSLAAGVYFYTLVLNGVAYTERLVVIK